MLGSSTVDVPRLGVGAMTWGDAQGMARYHPAKIAYGGADSAAEEAKAFEASLMGHVNLFDTASAYSQGAAEIRLGELAKGRDAIIASKFPMSFGRMRAEEFPAALEASLKRLGRTSIDLYQHHTPGRTDIDQLMALMADAVEAGRIRAVGVSNYSAAQMRQAHAALARRGVPLAANQVQYSLLHRRPEVDGVMAACRELGVTLIAYSPLAMGMLSGKYSHGEKARGVRRFLPIFNWGGRRKARPVVELLRTIGERYGKSPSQVALNWLIANPVVLPIPGAKNGKQAAENAGALGFSLSPDEIAEIDRATLGWKK
jgi:aryl-alcohol dehydrogenase-like predicted oxidoreductase